MGQFNTYLGLKIAQIVLSAAEEVARGLQAKDVNAQEATNQMDLLQSHIRRLRNENSFTTIFEESKQACGQFVDEPKLPRRKKVPRRLDDGSEAHQWTTAEEYFRSQFLYALDLLLAEIDRRFDQHTLHVLSSIEKLLIGACKAEAKIDIPNEIQVLYPDLSLTRLTAQLQMLPDLLQAYNQKQKIPVTSVTTISTLCAIMSDEKSTKDMFSQIHKLLRIYLTVPMSNATAERSFSALRLLKTYLRVTINQERLNHLLFLHIHKNVTDNIDLSQVMYTFCSADDRRIQYFGK